MKFVFYTLGCKVNQFETQAMERRVTELGHTLGTFGEPCDCCVVNTCTANKTFDLTSYKIGYEALGDTFTFSNLVIA